MKNNPAFLVAAVVLSLVVITAVATVTSTKPKSAAELAAAAAGNANNAESTVEAPAKSKVNTSPPTPKLSEIKWETTFEVALKKAKTAGKPIMIDFFATWCGPCKHLDENIYSANPVIDESANFINVKVDADKRGDLMQKYQITGMPTILWMNSEGIEMKRVQGAPNVPDQLVEMMKEVLNQPIPESVL